MKKIAVYGDSFVTAFDINKHFAWFNLLAKKLEGRVENDYSLDLSYGVGGCSTFYSYKKFLETHHRYDFVIFIAGDPYRYTKTINYNNYPSFMSNISTIEHFMNDENSTSFFKENLQKIKNWFEVSDNEYQELMQELMIKDVESKFSNNCLIIPANDKGFLNERLKNSNMLDFNMWDYCQVIHKSLNVPDNKWTQEPPKKINCHMTEEANILLADMLFDYFTKKTKLKLPDHIHHNHSWEYYYNE